MLLGVPFGREQPKIKGKVLKVRAFSIEQRAERNAQAEGILLGRQSEAALAIATGNPARLLQVVGAAPRGVPADSYERGANDKRARELTPLQKFYRRRIQHPLIYQFANAFRSGERSELGRLTRRIKADGWRSFLANVHPSNLPAIYKYIEKEDGRRPKVYAGPCARPLRYEV